MAEKRSLACTSSEAYHTVFIDTSLDTHLAVVVCDLDTVSDLKSNLPPVFFNPLIFFFFAFCLFNQTVSNTVYGS